MSEGTASGSRASGQTRQRSTSQPVIEGATENATHRPRVWISESGVTPPRLEGILSEGKMKTFLEEYADYKQDADGKAEMAWRGERVEFSNFQRGPPGTQ